MNSVSLGPGFYDGAFALVILGIMVFFVWALVDLWRSKATQDQKLLWTLLIVLVNPIGAIIWFAVGRKANQ